MDIRKVRLRISGGIAGLVRGTEFDAGDLEPGERHALERHLLQAVRAHHHHARDLQTYELEIDTNGGTHRVEFDEMNMPSGLDGLIQKLTRRSRPVPP
jgi:hypothetical protein